MPQSRAITHKHLMLATAAREPFDRAGWIYELKLDGFRCLAVKEAASVRMISRRGNPLEPCFPEIVRCLLDLTPKRLVLDGELVVLDEAGKPDFDRLCRRARTKKRLDVEHAARSDPAALFVFDLLVVGNRDVRKLPLLKRKELLQDVLDGSQRVRAVQYIGEQGQRLFDSACQLQFEGIMAKKAHAPYTTGRSRDWLKICTPAGRDVQEEEV